MTMGPQLIKNRCSFEHLSATQMGFTRRKPMDKSDCYPTVCRWGQRSRKGWSQWQQALALPKTTIMYDPAPLLNSHLGFASFTFLLTCHEVGRIEWTWAWFVSTLPLRVRLDCLRSSLAQVFGCQCAGRCLWRGGEWLGFVVSRKGDEGND